jgi:outer membrane lipoprotein carrier protein
MRTPFKTWGGIALTALSPLLLGLYVGDSGEELLQGFLRSTQTFEAEFVQQVRDSEDSVLEEASGRVWLSRPGRFRWHYAEPFEREIVSDGERLWMFDAELEQVTVALLAGGLGATPAGILTGDTAVFEKFVVDGLVETNDGIVWIDLTPKQAGSDFSTMRFGFDDDQRLVRLMLFDQLGQTTAIVFNDVKVNPEFADDLFEFVVPENADVIEQSGF